MSDEERLSEFKRLIAPMERVLQMTQEREVALALLKVLLASGADVLGIAKSSSLFADDDEEAVFSLENVRRVLTLAEER